MGNYTTGHQANIVLHVITGTLALLAGLAAIITYNRPQLHRRTGRVFLWLMTVVIITGLTGVLVFARNPFLLVITLLSGYMAWSGYRAVRHRSNRIHTADLWVPLAVLAPAAYFLYYLKTGGLLWSGVVVYSTLGYLVLAVAYDWGRYLIPPQRYGQIWLYEHMVKMISAFSGLLSAFTGTVLPQYHPYSQFGPSVLGTLLAIGFVVSVYRQKRRASVPAATLPI